MSKKGWISVSRSLINKDIWIKGAFDKGKAWIDLLLLANFADGEVDIRGNIISILRGQVSRSETRLAERWGWSRKKVKNFIKQLIEDDSITIKTTFLTSIITINNYNKFQSTIPEIEEPQKKGDSKHEIEPPDDPKGTAEAPQKAPQKEPLKAPQKKPDISHEIETNKEKKEPQKEPLKAQQKAHPCIKQEYNNKKLQQHVQKIINKKFSKESLSYLIENLKDNLEEIDKSDNILGYFNSNKEIFYGLSLIYSAYKKEIKKNTSKPIKNISSYAKGVRDKILSEEESPIDFIFDLNLYKIMLSKTLDTLINQEKSNRETPDKKGKRISDAKIQELRKIINPQEKNNEIVKKDGYTFEYYENNFKKLDKNTKKKFFNLANQILIQEDYLDDSIDKDYAKKLVENKAVRLWKEKKYSK